MAEEQQQSPDVLLAIENWLDITVDKFHEALDIYDIGKLDGELWKSIAGALVLSGGNVEEVIIQFLAYGRFVDMGVGRGMSSGSRAELGKEFFKRRNAGGQLHRHVRKAKPWYSKTKYREVARLREILADNLSGIVLGEVESGIRQGAIRDFQA